MIIDEAKKIARLLDTNGIITLRQNAASITLWVEITSIDKKTADFIKEKAEAGYSISSKRGKSFKFTIASDKAVKFLNKLVLFSKWQKDQIKLANLYQKYTMQTRVYGTSLGKSETDIIKTISDKFDKCNQRTVTLQKEYHENK